jgi:pimeloyl-ACP methyl ester carboxylesterase
VSSEGLAAGKPPHLRVGASPLDQIRAVRRMFIVLSAILDLGVVGPTMRALTREPRRRSVEIAGIPAEFVTPVGRGPRPAFVFVTGAHPLRRREPIVQQVADGLGRAGFVVVVPDLPGLGEGEITPGTLQSAIRVVEWTVRREEVAGGRVVLCGASVGASLALLVAERRELEDSISLVASVCPFSDLGRMICLATTRQYGADGPLGTYDAAILLRRVVARSLLMTLPESAERTQLLDCVGDILRDEQDPLEGLQLVDAESLSPNARSIVRLLTNADAQNFRALYDGLPADARALVETLSPLPRAAGVRARVELVVPPLDPYFPPGETQALAAALPNARLTVTSTLDHTRPMMSRAGVADLARFCGFVLRSLAAR